jgi:hypothetical protein
MGISSQFRVCAGLGLCMLLVGSGCSSSKDDPPAAGAGGSTAGAGGSSQAVGGAAGQDSGSTSLCSAKAPADPSPDLTGRWAWKTVGARQMPKTALTAAFGTRTVSILLADQTQTGTAIGVNAQYCDQYNEEDALAPTHVVIPDAYKRTLAAFTRGGTFSVQTGGAVVLNLPSFAEVQGAHVADPANGVLPTVATDPQVFDQDADGNPGVTIKIGGLVSGDLYVVQRQQSDLTGVATSADRVEGHYGFTSEQVILAADPDFLKAAASSQVAITDPVACASTFTMVRVAATTTCADIVANAATMFQ